MSNAAATGTERREQALQLAANIYPNQQRRLLAIATRHAPNVEDAEEALQDAFALFIDHFDPTSAAPPVAWLTLTLKRRCWAAYRKQQREQQDESIQTTTDHNPLPEEVAETTSQTTAIRQSFQQLKPQEKQALSLLALGYSYRDICDQTGWTYTKVNRCITEGRKRLRKIESARSIDKQPPPKGAKKPRS